MEQSIIDAALIEVVWFLLPILKVTTPVIYQMLMCLLLSLVKLMVVVKQPRKA